MHLTEGKPGDNSLQIRVCIRSSPPFIQSSAITPLSPGGIFPALPKVPQEFWKQNLLQIYHLRQMNPFRQEVQHFNRPHKVVGTRKYIPEADCPGFHSHHARAIDPSTCPHIPGIILPFNSSIGAMICRLWMFHYFIEIIRLYPRLLLDCATSAPVPIITVLFNPSRPAHFSKGSRGGSHVYVSSQALPQLFQIRIKRQGILLTETIPLPVHIALCPAAHLLRFIFSGSLFPVSSEGIHRRVQPRSKPLSYSLSVLIT